MNGLELAKRIFVTILIVIITYAVIVLWVQPQFEHLAF